MRNKTRRATTINTLGVGCRRPSILLSTRRQLHADIEFLRSFATRLKKEVVMAKSEINYSGLLERALLVQNVRSLQSHLQMSDGQLVDKLTIHFQRKKSSRGGDVEEVVFPLNSFKDDAIVIFEDAKDMQSAAQYEQLFHSHQLRVGRLPPVFTSIEANIDPFYFNIMAIDPRGECFKGVRKLPITVKVNKTNYRKISCSNPSQLKLVEEEVCRLLMSQVDDSMTSEEGAVKAADGPYSASEYTHLNRNQKEQGKSVDGNMDFSKENCELETTGSFSKQSDEPEDFFDFHSRQMEVNSASANGEHDAKPEESQSLVSTQDDGALGETGVDNIGHFNPSDYLVVLDNHTYNFLAKFEGGALQQIKKKNKVQIKVAKGDGNENFEGMILPSSNRTPPENVTKAKDEFIALYQQVHFSISRKTIDCSSAVNAAAVEKAAKETLGKFKADTLITKVDGRPSFRLILRRGDVEEVARQFRAKAGIKSGKTLRATGTDVLGHRPTSADKDSSNNTQFRKDNITEVRSPENQINVLSTAHNSQRGSGSLNSSFVTNEGLNIVIRTGDITKQGGDAVVSPSDSKLTNLGGVAKAILAAAGHQLMSYCEELMKARHFRDLQMSECIITPGYQLKYEMIIHACGPTYLDYQFERELYVTFLNCLRIAEQNCVTSLAVPLMGSGFIGAPKKQCADALAHALIDFSRESNGPKFVREVFLVNIDQGSSEAIFRSLQAFFSQLTDATPATGRGGGSDRHIIEGVGVSRSSYLDVRRPPVVQTPSVPPESHHSTVGAKGRSSEPESRESGGSGKTDQVGSVHSTAAKDDAYGNRPSPQDKSPIDKPADATGAPVTSSKVKTVDNKNEECPICLGDKIIDEVQLKCKHRFCKNCIERALENSYRCPVCKAVCREPKGNQPEGTMSHYVDQYSHLPGYDNNGVIVIRYYIPDGKQKVNHPNPGKPFTGTSRTAYLPDNQEGKEVLSLLRRAFDAGLVFTVGQSVSSGQLNVVTWNDIHHKTNRRGGPQKYGYPDPDYLKRVKEDLAAKGIV